MKRSVPLGLTLLLPACATIATGGGRDQIIVMETEPSGALCIAARKGAVIGTVTTPGMITVSRSRHPIFFHCMKEGCVETDIACVSSGNLFMTGSALIDLIQVGVDASTGAAWSYPRRLFLILVPVTGIMVGNVPPPHTPHLLPG